MADFDTDENQLMLSQIMQEVNNYFEDNSESGIFTIESGCVSITNRYLVGQYVAITGSALNSGVYKIKGIDNNVIEFVTDDPLVEHETIDEEFTGVIYSLSVPRDFIRLAKNIQTFAKSPAGKASAYVSESFGIDSRARAVASNGVPASWKEVFATQLHSYRKPRYISEGLKF